MSKYSNITSIPEIIPTSNTVNRIFDTKCEQETFIDFINIQTIDQAVVDFFTTTLDVSVTGENNKRIKVPVEYATQERWVKAAKEKGFRDKTGRIILPILIVKRTGEQLDRSRLIPRMEETEITIVKTPFSERSSEYLLSRDPPLKDNKIVYDIYSMPRPIYVIVNYEVTARTSFLIHMDEIEHQLFNGGGKDTNVFWINSGNYRFMSVVETPSDKSNIDDFSDSERILEKAFPITVNGYLLPEIRNKPNIVRHSRSFTRINFETEIVEEIP